MLISGTVELDVVKLEEIVCPFTELKYGPDNNIKPIVSKIGITNMYMDFLIIET
jgi:hypothetical protein